MSQPSALATQAAIAGITQEAGSLDSLISSVSTSTTATYNALEAMLVAHEAQTYSTAHGGLTALKTLYFSSLQGYVGNNPNPASFFDTGLIIGSYAISFKINGIVYYVPAKDASGLPGTPHAAPPQCGQCDDCNFIHG